MNVACRVLWGGSRSTKPCVFPCEVAAAGDERYLVCVILLSFAAEHRKSYWSGCIQAAAAIAICQQIFAILVLVIFLLKFFLKSASKSSFCRFGVEVLELQFPRPLRVVLLCFATQCLQIAL